jgi:hypothetical protein
MNILIIYYVYVGYILYKFIDIMTIYYLNLFDITSKIC